MSAPSVGLLAQKGGAFPFSFALPFLLPSYFRFDFCLCSAGLACRTDQLIANRCEARALPGAKSVLGAVSVVKPPEAGDVPLFFNVDVPLLSSVAILNCCRDPKRPLGGLSSGASWKRLSVDVPARLFASV